MMLAAEKTFSKQNKRHLFHSKNEMKKKNYILRQINFSWPEQNLISRTENKIYDIYHKLNEEQMLSC